MCTKNNLEQILSVVALQSKQLLSEKLHSVILFGSYARGDYDDESDIDIMILADIDDTDVNMCTRQIYEKIFQLELEYDCVLSLCVVPQNRFNKFKELLPFYRNVEREGVKIAV
ncbi:MAG: nucleotidyltransferase domain-containing protein [Faecalibacterium sp.]|nr:nucleotidyltransferase domain-containing protein [Ruminococcus sp.]MCM1392190.1 nucleotidyltransferase domain-containing protein [Ruminococcus sp.]MCM1485400.1 nucleotidyltransferase domain-containing protein [Faecalibacterium sp.]